MRLRDVTVRTTGGGGGGGATEVTVAAVSESEAEASAVIADWVPARAIDSASSCVALRLGVSIESPPGAALAAAPPASTRPEEATTAAAPRPRPVGIEAVRDDARSSNAV